jgi:hypothetical protein
VHARRDAFEALDGRCIPPSCAETDEPLEKVVLAVDVAEYRDRRVAEIERVWLSSHPSFRGWGTIAAAGGKTNTRSLL